MWDNHEVQNKRCHLMNKRCDSKEVCDAHARTITRSLNWRSAFTAQSKMTRIQNGGKILNGVYSQKDVPLAQFMTLPL